MYLVQTNYTQATMKINEQPRADYFSCRCRCLCLESRWHSLRENACGGMSRRGTRKAFSDRHLLQYHTQHSLRARARRIFSYLFRIFSFSLQAERNCRVLHANAARQRRTQWRYRSDINTASFLIIRCSPRTCNVAVQSPSLLCKPQ